MDIHWSAADAELCLSNRFKSAFRTKCSCKRRRKMVNNTTRSYIVRWRWWWWWKKDHFYKHYAITYLRTCTYIVIDARGPCSIGTIWVLSRNAFCKQNVEWFSQMITYFSIEIIIMIHGQSVWSQNIANCQLGYLWNCMRVYLI